MLGGRNRGPHAFHCIPKRSRNSIANRFPPPWRATRIPQPLSHPQLAVQFSRHPAKFPRARTGLSRPGFGGVPPQPEEARGPDWLVFGGAHTPCQETPPVPPIVTRRPNPLPP